MKIASKIRSGQRAAVFTRNFQDYLDEAVRIAKSSPTQRITFRAVRSWASVEEALAVSTPIPVYIALPNGGDGVEYVADLHQVQLQPVLGDPTTDELMKHVLPSTASEGSGEARVDAEVETLYVISNCRKVAAFSTAKLTKLSNGEPLSEDYRYSYSVVQVL